MGLFGKKKNRPPPPQVPEGWKTLWDKKKGRYRYINFRTRQNQWEVPTADLGAPPPYAEEDNGLAFNSGQQGSINGEGIDRIVDAVLSLGIIPNK